jgi:hypothetical protein
LAAKAPAPVAEIVGNTTKIPRRTVVTTAQTRMRLNGAAFTGSVFAGA